MTDWSDIVRQHGPLVWKTAYRLLSNEADASDCFQDAFVSAMELSRREPIRQWPAVLKRLTTARALERLRKRYRDTDRRGAWLSTGARPGTDRSDAQAAGGNLMDLVHDTQTPDPSQQLLDTEIADHLRNALTKLDARQAEVFCLSVLEELSYREVADQLDITVNHVGVMLHRAKQSLRDLLESYRPSRPESLGVEEKP